MDIKNTRGILTTMYKTQFLQLLNKNKTAVKMHTWGKAGVINLDNHRIYARYLGEKLGYEKMEDWYKISKKDIIKNKGQGLLCGYYANSPCKFVMEMFPDYEWLPWKFTRVIQDFWKDENNCKKYVNWLGKELRYTTMEHWYQITQDKFRKHSGGVIQKYNDSPIKFIMAMFPDYEWLPWKFKHPGRGYWNGENNRKKYAKWLGKELGYTTMEHWYQITLNVIEKNHGSGVVQIYYNDSPSNFVMAIFPKYKWLKWKFRCVSNGFWKDENNHKKYVKWLGKEMGYTTMENWYNISKAILQENYGGGLMGHYYNNCPSKFVMGMFPDFKWERSKFQKNYSRGQIQWLEFLKVSTPDIRHILNHRDGEFAIPGSRYRADGFSEKKHMIYEYLGDFWHGNPAIYNPDDINSMAKTTYGELYNNELKRQKFCEDSGFKYHSIWESEWHRGIQAIVQLQKKFKNQFCPTR